MILGNQSHLTPQLMLNFLKQFEDPVATLNIESQAAFDLLIKIRFLM